MTKEELLKRLHEILEIVGPDRAFEISENTNERKTLWIHQTPGEDEYLKNLDHNLCWKSCKGCKYFRLYAEMSPKCRIYFHLLFLCSEF